MEGTETSTPGMRPAKDESHNKKTQVSVRYPSGGCGLESDMNPSSRCVTNLSPAGLNFVLCSARCEL